MHPADAATKPVRANGWWCAILVALSAVLFVALRSPALPVHFQVDGQLAEYLAWSKSPAAIGDSLNQQLNPRLFSVYYPLLAAAARSFDRLDVLRTAFAVEIVMLALAVYVLGLVVTRNALAGAIASIAVVWGNGMALSLGGSGGVGLVCNPEFPATAVICIALALSWHRKHAWAALLAGLAFNVHGSIALFGAAMVCIAALLDESPGSRVRRVAVAWGLCLVSALPTVLWVFTTPAPDGGTAMDVWLRFPRWIYPHHVFVSETGGEAWLRLAAFVIPGVIGWAMRRDELRPQLSIVRGWLLAAVLLLAVGYVFVEVLPVRFVAQLTLWRGTRFVLFVALGLGLAWLIDIARAGGWHAVMASVAVTAYLVPTLPALAFVGHVALAVLIAALLPRARGMAAFLLIAALIVTALLAYLESSFLSAVSAYLAPRWAGLAALTAAVLLWATRRPVGVRLTGVVAMCLAVCAFLQMTGVQPTFASQLQQRAAALASLSPAIERACPAGRTVIAPPDLRNPGAWANRGSFLCRQQLTAYAYGPWLVEPLCRRMAWYLGEDVRERGGDEMLVDRLVAGYRRQGTTAFERLRDEHGVGVAIVELGQRLDYRVVAENDEFRVYDLSSPIETIARAQNVD